MTCGIYCITNKLNGKKYIGQSKNIEKRFQQHKWGKGDSLIVDMILRYGESNFSFDILKECSESQLDYMESKYIQEYNTREEGYNLQKGKVPFQKNCFSETGYLNVIQKHNFDGGLVWEYFVDGYSFQSSDLSELAKTVVMNGLKWEVTNKELARLSQKENKHRLKKSKSKTNTGFFRVSMLRNEKYANGRYYQYNTTQSAYETPTNIGSSDFFKLKEKVIRKGFTWKLVDEQKARECGLL